MRLIVIVLIALTGLTCSEDKKPTAPSSNNPPSAGTTQTYAVMYECRPQLPCTQGEADLYCVQRGYQKALTFDCRYECGTQGWGNGRLNTVVCWKP